MPGNLNIFIGNQLETLVGALAELIRGGPGGDGADPLQPEIVLVQSKGMQRWVSMALARMNGICANMAFPFPNTFLEQTYTNVIGPLPAHNPFDPRSLTFRIMALIDEMAEHAAFGPIRNYLSGSGSDLKRYQLSRKIADVFDQYLVFRPEIIFAWERGQMGTVTDDQAWQAFLWQRIRSDVNSPHRADLQKNLIDHLNDNHAMPLNLPARVSVFGISYLPVFHLQALDALARRIPVYLYLLNPCRQYWADIRSDHQLIRMRTRGKTGNIDPADLHYERGHRLLSSWGGQGRQFFGILDHLDAHVVELFEDRIDMTLLGNLQKDILDLVDRSEVGQQERPAEARALDGTLRVQACHSPMREVEVLHDQLLDVLDGHSDINPGDILVMTPDISQYAPYIHAVFGSSRHAGGPLIPYSLADQSIVGESRLVEGYFRLLGLKDGRFEASQILALLEYEAIRKRFELEEGDLHKIETWLREANIRWGWDKSHRQQHGLPRFETNTWRAGLDRLIAGYAMSFEQDELFAGVLPHAGIEGSDAQILGRLIRFVETLYQDLDNIPEKTALEHWASILTAMVDTFFHTDDAASRDIQALRGAIEQLDDIAAQIQSGDAVSFEVVRQFLTDNLMQASSGTGFMAGSVTFCSILPMRSIPAKVICLLGMQHDAFPREMREPGFSLIAADSRPGDRSKRNDDQYLFLEALLSARNIFYISYVGRDIQDNSPKPPSVLVSELLEYIATAYGLAEKRMILEHPLQPFSPAYFDGRNPRLFSYSKDNREALRRMSAQGRVKPFFSEALPPPDESWRHCNLSQLGDFFANPSKYILEQRLGIYLRDTPDIPEDRERFNLDPLSIYHISQTMLESILNGRSTAEHFEIAAASGELPPGTAATVVHDKIDDDVNRFLEMLESVQPDDEPVHADLDLDIAGFHIAGRIGGIYKKFRIAHRMARLRPRDLLSGFIAHLVLNLMPPDKWPHRTLLVCKDAVWEFNPMDNGRAADALKTYLGLYWEGLRKPVPFFGKSSHEYAFKRIVKQKERREALKEAFKKWQGNYFQAGESQDPHIHLCFKHSNPISDDFESLALGVFAPLFACGHETRQP